MAVLLVVDDDQDICEVVALGLGDEGHVVNCAFTTKDALKSAAATRPDLAIVDFLLQGSIDGLELADQLSSMGIAVVMMSGVIDGDERLSESSYPLILKPFHVRSLVDVVSESLNGSRRAHSS
jgi:DNA-binding response OmpR family regulator